MIFLFFFKILVREALRQINIQMIDSGNICDGLETLWLGSADENLSSQQVNLFIYFSFEIFTYSNYFLGYY
jgi:hypothetical protein